MPVFEAEAREQHRLLVRLLEGACATEQWRVRVLEEEQMRRLPEEHAAVAEQDARRETEAVGEDRDFVRATVAIGVFENLDAVAALLAGLRAERILVKLHDPQPTALVPRHRDGVHDLRLAGEEANFEARWQRELLLRLLRRERGRGGRGVLPGHLFAGRGVLVSGEAKVLLRHLVIGGGKCGSRCEARRDSQHGEAEWIHSSQKLENGGQWSKLQKN